MQARTDVAPMGVVPVVRTGVAPVVPTGAVRVHAVRMGAAQVDVVLAGVEERAAGVWRAEDPAREEDEEGNHQDHPNLPNPLNHHRVPEYLLWWDNPHLALLSRQEEGAKENRQLGSGFLRL